VVPDLFVVDLPVEFVVMADVEDAFAGDPDPISALGLLDGTSSFDMPTCLGRTTSNFPSSPSW